MYWIWVAQGRQEIDIDFAWKHAEVLLVERKSNWGEKERLRMEGGRLAGSCRVNVDQRVGGWAESMGGHIDGQQNQQGFRWLLEMMQV